MKNRTLITILFIICNLHLTISQVEWGLDLGGFVGNSVTSDDLGNIYTIGRFNGTEDLDPSSAIQYYTCAGYSDAFIQKFDAIGNLIWLKVLAGSSTQYPSEIVVDALGNVIICGSFKDTIDLNPGIAVQEVVSNGLQDIYILKLDSNGDFIWAKNISGPQGIVTYSVETDDSANIYLVGDFRDTVDFDPSNSVDLHVSKGNTDAFIEKFDPNGNMIWTKTFGGTGVGNIRSIEINNEGDIIVGGIYKDSVDFDPGLGVEDTISTLTGLSVFISKFSTDGELKWSKTFGCDAWAWLNDLTIDNQDNIVSTGYFTMDFDASGDSTAILTDNGWADIFVQKIDTDGNYINAFSLGAWSWDEGNSISTDQNNNIYLTGRFNSMVDFDPGPGTYFMDSGPELIEDSLESDLFVLKLSENLDFLWAGESNSDDDYDEKGNSIVVDPFGAIIVTGYYNTECDFSLGNGNLILSGGSGDRSFLLKLNSSVGLEDYSDQIILAVYPNPTLDNISIDFPETPEMVDLKIRNVSGQLLRSSQFLATGKVLIDLPSSAGLYFIEISSINYAQQLKIIKK